MEDINTNEKLEQNNVSNEDTIKRIKDTLEKIKPFLEREGGSCEFDSFEDGIVYIKMTGACEGCMYVNQDIEQGIEVILMEEVPGVVAVRLAEEKEQVKEAMRKIREESEAYNKKIEETNNKNSEGNN